MFPKFLRPEVLLYASIERLTAPAPSAESLRARLTDSAPPPPVICAWCPAFDATQQPAGVSHGLCQACSDRLIFEAMKRAEQLDDERDELCGSTCGANCGFCGACS